MNITKSICWVKLNPKNPGLIVISYLFIGGGGGGGGVGHTDFILFFARIHFKDNEGIYAYHYQYNIGPSDDLNTSTLLAFIKPVDLFYEKNMSDYWIKVNRKPTGLTISGNNRNDTALVVSQDY